MALEYKSIAVIETWALSAVVMLKNQNQYY